jgi:hypothetical protein
VKRGLSIIVGLSLVLTSYGCIWWHRDDEYQRQHHEYRDHEEHRDGDRDRDHKDNRDRDEQRDNYDQH